MDQIILNTWTNRKQHLMKITANNYSWTKQTPTNKNRKHTWNKHNLDNAHENSKKNATTTWNIATTIVCTWYVPTSCDVQVEKSQTTIANKMSPLKTRKTQPHQANANISPKPCITACTSGVENGNSCANNRTTTIANKWSCTWATNTANSPPTHTFFFWDTTWEDSKHASCLEHGTKEWTESWSLGAKRVPAQALQNMAEMK